MLTLTACSDGGGPASATLGSTPPTASQATTPVPTASAVATVPSNGLSVPGSLIACDDLSYPPLAYVDGQGKPSGVDIGIFAAIAQRLSLQLQVRNVQYHLDPNAAQALTQSTCDVLIGDVPPVEEGWGWADFIEFVRIGGAYVVAKGNPQHLETEADLCGKAVAAVGPHPGTKQQDWGGCTDNGADPVTVQTVATEEDALRAVASGQVAAYSALLRVAGPDVVQQPEQFDLVLLGSGVTEFETMLIPAEKQALADAVDAALLSMVTDGTYDQVLQGWSLQKSATCVQDMHIWTGAPYAGSCDWLP